MLCERSADAAERSIGLARELLEVTIAQLPQLGRGEREQRERTRLIGDVFDHLGGQLGILELVPRAARRLDQDAQQVVGMRHGDQLQRLADAIAKRVELLGADEKVVAQHDDDANRVLFAARERRQGLGERAALRRVLAEREDLLELIDDDDERPVPRGVIARSIGERALACDSDLTQPRLEDRERHVAGAQRDRPPPGGQCR